MRNKNLMYKTSTYLLALFTVLTVFTSCKKEYETTEELDNRNIKSYKDAHPNLAFTDVDGYSYSITEPGTGSAVVNTDSVYYSYAFKSTSGTVYNQTSDLVITGTLLGYTDRFAIGGSIYSFKPVREVLGKLKRGGKAVLLLPSRMAFGKNGLSNFGIGSNEMIVVELGLYSFEKRHQVDAFETQTFITKNNLTFNTDPSGVKYNISTPGTGADLISSTTTFVCNYTGRFLDGTIFDQRSSETLRLRELVTGWEVIAGKLSAGGKIRMIIPSHLGYGNTADPKSPSYGRDFPSNKVLDFEIEIVSVTKD
ncbi:FKBP-type peptidyl-prolyl cis-trans isomerase [Pedobacter nanyangensis]|uniref:FKBP-type peptidyl-prolyl cis-trans isomerase n=1 Tax=Pedobacter nanyangensis TaxID=1562389 RepID=UPI000DE20836|nr:FKBP-type peptidyl-prolyl cis-trans isomerase [Pedobacter nanyangensis]